MASERKPVNAKPKRKSKKNKKKEEQQQQEEQEAAHESSDSWGALPLELSAKILGLLPLHHAVNAQAVCKQWRASLLRHSISRDAKGDMLSPLLLFSTWCGYHVASTCCGYHAPSRTWLRYPNLAVLPFSITRVHSSHRGLLLVEADATSCLYLCNLATRRHWQLPPLPPDASNRAQRVDLGGSMYWCHCHLQVDVDVQTFTVIALMRTSCVSGWPELLGFDSRRGSWSPLQVDVSLASCSLTPKVFFEGVDRMVVQSNGTIYMMVPGREASCYLVKYDPQSCVWVMVDKLLFSSAQIVALQDTVMVVALDRLRGQVHLYRVEEEQLVLEESSGPELAEFVEDCTIHYWYTTFCASSRHIYVGVSVNEAVAHNVQQALVEYEGLSRSWRHVALPKFDYDNREQETSHSFCSTLYSHSFRTRSTRAIIIGAGYDDLGLATDPDCPAILYNSEV